MKKLDKHSVILRKVEQLKRSEFGATAIKIELEAHFDRGRSYDDRCEDCEDGSWDCGECNGYNEAECSECEGRGQITVDNPAWTTESGPEVESSISEDCDNCDGTGNVSCEYCDEGRVACDSCDGSGQYDTGSSWGNDQTCHDYIMSKLAELGLAEEREEMMRLSHGQYTKWYPKGALKYAEFYRDGSVDSELTATISLENNENIFLLPELIRIFTSLKDQIGNGMNLRRAGMHMALINDPECRYIPGLTRGTDEHLVRFGNFRKSMTLLLPALFFLGSDNDKSRELGFRIPRVSNSDKYSAIFYNCGAIEYRVFNTCYDDPQSVLDNVVVMANTMKYWVTTYRPSGLSRITDRVNFGVESDDSLARFYITSQHIDLLNTGLKRLKPSYYTIGEVKRQRKFNVTKHKTRNLTKAWRQQAESEYEEYEQRFGWDLIIRKNRIIADVIEHQTYTSNLGNLDQTVVLAEAERRAEIDLNAYREQKRTRDDYIQKALADKERSTQGSYTLREA